MSSYTEPTTGKTFVLVPQPGNEIDPCKGCAFNKDGDMRKACWDAPDCSDRKGKEMIFVEQEEPDCLSGVQACDLTGEGTCEACQ